MKREDEESNLEVLQLFRGDTIIVRYVHPIFENSCLLTHE